MEKLFLLDAYALIYRAYYAFIKNPRINSKGFNTSAIMGFVNTLEDVLKKEQRKSSPHTLESPSTLQVPRSATRLTNNTKPSVKRRPKSSVSRCLL